MASRTAPSLLGALMLALAVLGAPPAEAQRQGSSSGNVAGKFDYYTLVLSWSPTHCAGLASGDTDPQCREPRAKPYAFVLHGLWPQHERGFPLSCATGRAAYVPRPVLDRMRDLMPNPRLTIHEYRRHGTCSGLDPDGYYTLARRLAEQVNVPPRFEAPADDQFLSPTGIIDEFVAANPELKPEMLAVTCGGPGNRLKDVRVCFDRDGGPRSCGPNESRQRLCRASRLHIPPVRLAAPAR